MNRLSITAATDRSAVGDVRRQCAADKRHDRIVLGRAVEAVQRDSGCLKARHVRHGMRLLQHFDIPARFGRTVLGDDPSSTDRSLARSNTDAIWLVAFPARS